MAGTIELVHLAEVGEDLFGLGCEEEGVEIAVGTLRAGHVGDGIVELLLEGGIGSEHQGVGAGLDPLGDVTVPELVGLGDVGGAGFPRQAQSAEAAGGLALLILLVDGAIDDSALAIGEQAAGETDGRDGGGCELGHVLLLWAESVIEQARHASGGGAGTGRGLLSGRFFISSTRRRPP